MNKRIILASSSPRRKMLLEKLGLSFEVKESNFKEDMAQKIVPKKLVRDLALGKAKAVVKKLQGYRNDNKIIIAADTIVVLGGKIMGKPNTAKNAIAMLKKLSGKSHFIYTGLVVMDLENKKTYKAVVMSKLIFRKLSSREILAYVKSGEPLDKAGAYAIQENGGVFVEKIFGDYNNIVGLPIAKLIEILKRLGVKI